MEWLPGVNNDDIIFEFLDPVVSVCSELDGFKCLCVVLFETHLHFAVRLYERVDQRGLSAVGWLTLPSPKTTIRMSFFVIIIA